MSDFNQILIKILAILGYDESKSSTMMDDLDKLIKEETTLNLIESLTIDNKQKIQALNMSNDNIQDNLPKINEIINSQYSPQEIKTYKDATSVSVAIDYISHLAKNVDDEKKSQINNYLNNLKSTTDT